MGQRSSGHGRATGKIMIGAALLTIAPWLVDAAQAAKPRHPHAAGHTQTATIQLASGQVFSFHSHSKYTLKGGKARYAYAYGGYSGPHLQCVSFARAASGIELKGNAANWWDAAAGIYERGSRPEPGSVLNFRSRGGMRLGHVAVVTAVMGSRQIEIEHANWSGVGANKAGVTRNVPVIDVSADNDWSAVRVGLGQSGDYGSVYPTYGFIYDRPDHGVMVANERAGGAFPAVMAVDEVAQATPRRKQPKPLDLELIGDAPSRTLR